MFKCFQAHIIINNYSAEPFIIHLKDYIYIRVCVFIVKTFYLNISVNKKCYFLVFNVRNIFQKTLI